MFEKCTKINLENKTYPVVHINIPFFFNIQAKCEFYLDHMSEFRRMKHKLSESIPVESLDFIQKIMDKNVGKIDCIVCNRDN